MLALLLAPAALRAQGTPSGNDSTKVTELAPIEVTASRAAQAPAPRHPGALLHRRGTSPR